MDEYSTSNTNETIHNWYMSYSNDIYKFILYMLNDHEQAKDLMQDTFIRAYHNLDSYRGESTKGWLFKIARNITIDFIKRKKPIYYSLDSFRLIPSKNPTPEKVLDLNEQERQLYLALAKLKRPYREVIILRKIKEFSTKETAEILGWKEGRVKTTLWRALGELKKQLEKGGYEYEEVK